MAGAAPPQATTEQDVVVVIRFPTATAATTLEAWRAPAAASRVGYGEWGASLEFARCIVYAIRCCIRTLVACMVGSRV